MSITVPVEISKTKFETFGELAENAFQTAMQFGRELIRLTLEARDEEPRDTRDKGRYRCKGKRRTCIKTKLGEVEFERNVYEDKVVTDGIWLKMQGEDRKKYGTSKEMKVGIAYDGATWSGGKDGKSRRTLDCKVAHASFEQAKAFHESKEGIIASRFKTEKIEQRVTNGDGAGWVRQSAGKNNISVLDPFHRNKKLRECVRNPEIIQQLQKLLYGGKISDLLNCIDAYSNPVENEDEKAGSHPSCPSWQHGEQHLYIDREPDERPPRLLERQRRWKSGKPALPSPHHWL